MTSLRARVSKGRSFNRSAGSGRRIRRALRGSLGRVACSASELRPSRVTHPAFAPLRESPLKRASERRLPPGPSLPALLGIVLRSRRDALTILECCLVAEAKVAGRHLDNIAPSLFGGIVLVRSLSPIEVVRLPAFADELVDVPQVSQAQPL